MKYRKKPVVVEAVRFDGSKESANTVLAWIGSNGSDAHRTQTRGERVLVIDTLEGQMRADAGDYVIRGVQGEFYPCKPDIFAATYEPFDPEEPAAPATRIECPECAETVRVPIAVELHGEPGEQRITAEPDLADLWAHAWTHTDGSRSA